MCKKFIQISMQHPMTLNMPSEYGEEVYLLNTAYGMHCWQLAPI